MADERLGISIDVDASQVHAEIQRMQLAARQMTSSGIPGGIYGSAADSMMYQNAMGSANQFGGMNGMNPMRAFAQQSYMNSVQSMRPSSPFQQSFTGLYGEPTMVPSYNQSQYQYPQGFIPGQPVPVHQYGRGTMATHAGHIGRAGFGAALGMAGVPYLKSSSLDMPIHRQIEMMGDQFANSVVGMPLRGIEGAVGYGAQAAALASMVPNFALGWAGNKMGMPGLAMSGGMRFGLGAAGVIGSTVYNNMRDVREYMDIGQSFRDASAPFMRSNRLSGGANAQQTAQFQRGLSQTVANDTQGTRSDYAGFLNIMADSGYMQTLTSPEKMNQALDNFGKQVKTLYSLGVKVKDTLEATQVLTSLGFDMGANPAKTAAFMSQVSLNAFQSGRTTSDMFPMLSQASQMSRQQGLAGVVGASTYASNVGNVGEMIRMGGLNQSNLNLLGGRENIESGVFNTLMTNQRTPMGQLYTMELANRMSKGKELGKPKFRDVLGGISDYSTPEEYFKLQANMPYLSSEINKKDPNALGLGNLNYSIDAYGQMLGKDKMDYGTVYNMLVQQGNTPEDARAMLATIAQAPNVTKGTGQSARMKMAQLQFESLRPKYDLLSAKGRANFGEGILDPIKGELSAQMTGLIGGVSESYQNMMFKLYTGGTLYNPNEVGITEKMRSINKQMGETSGFDVYNSFTQDSLESSIDNIDSSARTMVGGVRAMAGNFRDVESRTKDYKKSGMKSSEIKPLSESERQSILSKIKDGSATESDKNLLSMDLAFYDKKGEKQAGLNTYSTADKDPIDWLQWNKSEATSMQRGGQKVSQQYGQILNGISGDFDFKLDEEAQRFYKNNFAGKGAKMSDLAQNLAPGLTAFSQTTFLNDLAKRKYGVPNIDSLNTDQLNSLGRIVKYAKTQEGSGTSLDSVEKGMNMSIDIDPTLQSAKDLQSRVEGSAGFDLLKDITGSALPTGSDLEISLMATLGQKKTFVQKGLEAVSGVLSLGGVSEDAAYKALGLEPGDTVGLQTKIDKISKSGTEQEKSLLLKLQMTPLDLTKRNKLFRTVGSGMQGGISTKDLDQYASLNSGTMSADASRNLRRKMNSSFGDNVGLATDADSLLDKLMSKGSVSNDDLEKGFSSWSQSSELDIRYGGDLAQEAMRQKKSGTFDAKVLTEMYTKLAQEVGANEADIPNLARDFVSDVQSNKTSAKGIGGAVAQIVAAGQNNNTTMTTGTRTGEGYIDKQVMVQMAEGIRQQTESAKLLKELFNKIDMEGFMGAKSEKELMTIGKGIGEGLATNSTFVALLKNKE